MSEDGVYRTSDMALATLLRGQGHTYTLERLGKNKAIWVFKDSDALDDLIDAYEEYGARVEPRTFMRDHSEVRTEMYRFMGIPQPAHRNQLHSAPSTDAASA